MSKPYAEVIGVDELGDRLQDLRVALTGSAFTRALYQGGLVVEREAKINITKHGLIDTGALKSSVEARDMDAREVWIVSDKIYSAIHEYGGEITPKRAKALRFQVNGRWVTTQRVRIPARPYLRPALDENRTEIINAIRAAAEILLDKGGRR